MMSMPERLWAEEPEVYFNHFEIGNWGMEKSRNSDVEYIRVDVYEAELANYKMLFCQVCEMLDNAEYNIKKLENVLNVLKENE